MSRLIDADKFKETILQEYLNGKKTLMEVINEQPIAFDTNIVYEQLLLEKANLLLDMANAGDEENNSEYKKLADWLDKIIGIVEDGGVK